MATCRLCGQMDLPFADEMFRQEVDADYPQLSCVCHPCYVERFEDGYNLEFKRAGVDDVLPDANRYTERRFDVGNRWKE